MAKYNANNPKPSDDKKRIGSRPVSYPSGQDFLPQVFRTPLNEKFMDVTLDQLISKGDLKDVQGSIATSNAITNYTNSITQWNDVVNHISNQSTSFNYGKAFSTTRGVYNPPIDLDKFTNYQDYQWVYDMPVYNTDANNNTIIANFDTNVKRKIQFTDSNGVITPFNGMLIRFKDTNNTYMVAGQGENPELIPYDVDSRIEYPLVQRYAQNIKGTWDQSSALVLSRWSADGYHKDFRQTNPFDIINDFNTLPNQPAALEFWNLDDDCGVFLTDGMLIKFNSEKISGTVPGWNLTDYNSIYYVTIENNGNIKLLPINESDYDYTLVIRNGSETVVRNSEIAGTDTIVRSGIFGSRIRDDLPAEIETKVRGWRLWDDGLWDGEQATLAKKDYHVVNRLDPYRSAWSRTNFWVHKDDIKYLNSIMEFNYLEIIGDSRRAKRPIIEYKPEIKQWNGAWTSDATKWLGIVDYLVYDDYTNLPFRLPDGATYMDYRYQDKVWVLQNGSPVVKHEVQNGQGLFIGQVITQDDTTRDMWQSADAYINNNGELTVAQRKDGFNQPILWDVCDVYGNAWSSYDESNFAGTKLFGYKVNDINDIDPETDLPLEYLNGRYQFESYAFTDEWYYSQTTFEGDTTGTRKLIDTKPYYKIKAGKDSLYSSNCEPAGAWSVYTDSRETAGQIDFTIDPNDIDIKSDFSLTIDRRYNDLVIYENTQMGLVERSPVGVYLQPGQVYQIKSNYSAIQDALDAQGMNSISMLEDDAPRDVYLDGLWVRFTTDEKSAYRLFEVTVDGSVYSDWRYDAGSNTLSVLNLNGSERVELKSRVFSAHPPKGGQKLLIDVFEDNPINHELNYFTSNDVLQHFNNLLSGSQGRIHSYAYTGVGLSAGMNIPELNVQDSLLFTARAYTEWHSRAISLIRKELAVSSQLTSKQVVDSVLSTLHNNMFRDTGVNSNMLYPSGDKIYTANLEDWTSPDVTEPAPQQGSTGIIPYNNRLQLNTNLHSDATICDHLYVWLDGVLLCKHLDYHIKDHTIEFTPRVSMPSTGVTVEYAVIAMDNLCRVPMSFAKMGLTTAVTPVQDGADVVGHDGVRYAVSGQIADAVLELERRMYAGVVHGGNRTKTYKNFMPNVNRDTWYANTEFNNYVEPFLMKRARALDVDSWGTPDINDREGWTWNYSSLGIAGYWRSAYKNTFNTDIPHIAPWEILGFCHKPTWWDDHYAWDNQDQRLAMLYAFETGLVSNPSSHDVHDARYASSWDWTSNSPVDSAGNLRPPAFVLGEPADADKFRAFTRDDGAGYAETFINSQEYQALAISAVIKLNPVEAWEQLYRKNNNNYNNPSFPGEINSVISEIIVEFSDTAPQGTEWGVQVLDRKGNGATCQPVYRDGKLSLINMTKRGGSYSTRPIVDVGYSTRLRELEDEHRVDTTVKTKKVAYTASGVIQAQYNYLIFKLSDIDIKQFYSGINVKRSWPVSGFTKDTLLNIKADSSVDGKFEITRKDFNIEMHRSVPDTLVKASAIRVKKQDSGYRVYGYGAGIQAFQYYAVDTKGNNSYSEVELPSGAVLRKYKKFLTASPLIQEYGASFNRIQDLYNFILGYYEYLKDSGYTPESTADGVAIAIAKWATTADINAEKIEHLGNTVTVANETNTLLEFNTLENNLNAIMTLEDKPITSSEITVTRYADRTDVYSPYAKIGSITGAVVEYQHHVLFNNKTNNNDIVYSPELNHFNSNVSVLGKITSDWKGQRKAPGYLVFPDTIVENWDSSADAIRDYFDLGQTSFKPSVDHVERALMGMVDRKWLQDLHLDEVSAKRLFQGLLREKGTNQVISRINNTNLFNAGRTDISIDEEMMFRQANYGSRDSIESAEFELDKFNIGYRRAVINLAGTSDIEEIQNGIINLPETDERWVNRVLPNFTTDTFPEYDARTTIPTAGQVRKSEADFRKFTVSEIKDIPLQDTINSWSSTKSYKLNDQVRYQGQLWQWSGVQSVGIAQSGTGVAREGILSNPTFASGTVANINGNAITLTKTSTQYSNAVATSNSISSIANGTSLVISGTGIASAQTIIFGATVDQQIKDTSVEYGGDPFVTSTNTFPSLSTVVFSNVEGKNLLINSFPVDFDDTPNDINETISAVQIPGVPGTDVQTGDGVTDTFQFTDTLTSVEVDGQQQTQGVDYNVSNNDITFTTPPAIGLPITILTTTPPTMLDTYPITTPLGLQNGTFWQVAEVTLGGQPTTNYSVSGSDITINDPINVGQQIEITVRATPKSKTLQDVITDIITQVGSTGINPVYNFSTGEFTIHFDTGDTDTTSSLTIGDSEGATDLGFAVNVYPPALVITPVDRDITPSEAVQQINNAFSATNNLIATLSSNSEIVISLTPPTPTTFTQLTLAGDYASLGFTQINNSPVLSVGVDLTLSEAVTQLNTALQPTVLASISTGGNLIMSTADETLDLGSTSFNTQAGLAEGIQTAGTSDAIENTFVIKDGTADGWVAINDSDPELYSIHVVEDNELEYTFTPDGLAIKRNDWNVFAWQKTDGQYVFDSGDPMGCGICAGNSTSDGNDARICTVLPHGVQVGDYIKLVNTTSTPSADGVHKVTRIDNEFNFYIDFYIESCGTSPQIYILRGVRFDTEAEAIQSLTEYNYRNNDKIFIRTADAISVNEFNSSTLLFDEIRNTSSRPKQNDLMNVVLWDKDKNEIIKKIEVFDPLRGIIPGFVDKNIDFRSDVDLTAYNKTTDDDYKTFGSQSWGLAEVGTVWWDTSKLRYLDYDQESDQDQRYFWGKLYEGSSVDVYEWTRSNVPPDEWADVVNKQTDQYGTVPSGEAYVVGEDLYYWSQQEEWNPILGKLETAYYFWVKNKNTISSTQKDLTTQQMAEIIATPSNFELPWCAVTDTNKLIINGISEFLNNSTVLQINKYPSANEHADWTAIRFEKDLIPEYWYSLLRDNVVGIDPVFGTQWPNRNLHPYKRYGTDRVAGQGWFTNIFDARREALSSANLLVKEMNLVDWLPNTWDRTLGGKLYPVVVKDSSGTIIDRITIVLSKAEQLELMNGTRNLQHFRPYTYDMNTTMEFLTRTSTTTNILDALIGADFKQMWDYADWQSDSYAIEKIPTLNITDIGQLVSVNDKKHSCVMLKKTDAVSGLDTSEVYYYTTEDDWTLVFKRNATIQFNDMLWDIDGYASWDSAEWDSTNWDINLDTFTFHWIEALRNDIFVDQYISNFNKFFYALIDHVLATQDSVDWCYKNTFITLNIDTEIDKDAKIYTKNNIDALIGYVETVKPFHTQIKDILEKWYAQDTADVIVQDYSNAHIEMQYSDSVTVGVSDQTLNFIERDTDQQRLVNNTATMSITDSLDIKEEELHTFADTVSVTAQELGNISADSLRHNPVTGLLEQYVNGQWQVIIPATYDQSPHIVQQNSENVNVSITDTHTITEEEQP